MVNEHGELREFRLEELSAPHLIGAELFAPFAAKRLGAGGETEAILNVQLMDIAEPGEAQSKLRLMWSADLDLAGRERPAVQGRTVTELAACTVACVVCQLYAGLQITEIAQEGDRFDYWVSDGTQEFGLEVSGTMGHDVRKRHREKIAQLRKNPYGADGFVVVTGFASRVVIFSFNHFRKR